MLRSDNETAWSTLSTAFWQGWGHWRLKKGKMIHGSAAFKMQRWENSGLNWHPERGWGLLLGELQKPWMWCWAPRSEAGMAWKDLEVHPASAIPLTATEMAFSHCLAGMVNKKAPCRGRHSCEHQSKAPALHNSCSLFPRHLATSAAFLSRAFSQLTQKMTLWQPGTVSSGYFPSSTNKL